MTATEQYTPPGNLVLALVLAAAVHAALIFTVGFDIEIPDPAPETKLEIILVQNPQPSEKPDKPEALAQTSQQGSGNLDRPAVPKTRPAAPSVRPTRQASSAPPPQPQAENVPAPEKLQSRTPDEPAPIPKTRATRVETPPPALSMADLVASQRTEIARLSAELDRKTEAYSRRPRRKAISASTQEYKYANYLDAWTRKVERIGNLNYPEEAKRRGLYGNLVLHVAVKRDGSVERVRLLRSSGQRVLDDAAVRIVKLAAPFAPFPAEIRRETDILDITRTWRFHSGNQLLTAD
jgi:protein TonB